MLWSMSHPVLLEFLGQQRIFSLVIYCFILFPDMLIFLNFAFVLILSGKETDKTFLLLERELRTHLEALSKEKNWKMAQLKVLIKVDEQLLESLLFQFNNFDMSKTDPC